MKKLSLPALMLIVALFEIIPLNGTGNFQVNIVNNTGNPAVKVYILVKGINPTTNQPAFIQFKNGSAVGTYAGVTTPDADINNPTQCLHYAYEDTFFKQSNGQSVMHLPYLNSGRIYISLNHPIKIPVVGTAPNLGFADPSPFNTSDPSYQYLYDKVEFTYLNNGQTYMNPTAVDCLSLPIKVAQNNVIYGISTARDTMMKSIGNMLSASGISAQWKRLVIKNNAGTILRVVAPGRDPNFFDPNYLNGYITALWNYYQKPTNPKVAGHALSIDCTELTTMVPGLGNYIFTGQVIGNNFVFTNANNTLTVPIGKPGSDNFFMADQGTFSADNGTVAAVIIRNLCAAWSVGLLPVADGTILNKNYYLAQKAKNAFYNNNTLMPASGPNLPWYDLYAKAIHSVSTNIYAFAYDDAVGLDGTNASTDQHPATLTIGALGATVVP